MKVYINHTASFLPNEPLDNQQMEAVLGEVNNLPSRIKKIILKSNGINSRYYAIDPKTRETTHNCAQLASLAVEDLFKQGVNKSAISCLACGTSYPDQVMPGHGVMVHGLLDTMPSIEVMSTAGICVAGMSALKYAYNSIKTGEHQEAISCAAEAASAIMRKETFQQEIEQLDDFKAELAFEKDFLRWMLSDGAGAVHLSDQPNKNRLSLEIKWIDIISYANEMPVCMYAGADYIDGDFKGWKAFPEQLLQENSLMSVKQDVKLLNEHIIDYTVKKTLSQSIAKHHIKPEEIDYFLPHYSSKFFKDKVYQGLKEIDFEIPAEKWFTNLAKNGNTGSASIYIIIDEFLKTHDLKAQDKILCYIPESGRFSSSFMLLEVYDGR